MPKDVIVGEVTRTTAKKVLSIDSSWVGTYEVEVMLPTGSRTRATARPGDRVVAPYGSEFLSVRPAGSSSSSGSTSPPPPPPPPHDPSLTYDGTFAGTHDFVNDVVSDGNAGLWEDVQGSRWDTLDDQLRGTAIDSMGFTTQFLLRPEEEISPDAFVEAQVPAAFWNDSALLGLVTRWQSNGDHYLCHVNSGGSVFVYRVIGGNPTLLDSRDVTYDPGRPAALTFAAFGQGGTVSLYFGYSPLIGEGGFGLTVSDDNEDRIVADGQVGLSVWQSGNVFVDRVRTGPYVD